MGFFDNFRKVEPIKQEPRVLDKDLVESIMFSSIELPKPKEELRFDWVLFGRHNEFPLELLKYRNESAIHSAIIDSKSTLISGQGFIFDTTRELSNKFIVENWKLIPFWRKLDNVFYLVTRDQQTFGYSCFEVIYSVDRTRIADINWIDASRIAPGKKDEYDNIKEYFYCEDWSNTQKNPPRKIEAFDPNGEAIRQLVFIKEQENNMDYFALPSYYSALKWIKADVMMGDYNLSALTNGFSPSVVFKFYKKPTPDERRFNSEMIKAQHGGYKNAGKAIIFYSDGKELAPDVDTLDTSNIDNRLLQLSEQIVQQVISGHRANPTLCGIPIPGKLGYSNEVLQSWSLFNSLVIKPERKKVLDYFREVLVYNGISRIDIEELVPIEIIEEENNDII
jgi:hypothetical protein